MVALQIFIYITNTRPDLMKLRKELVSNIRAIQAFL